MENFETFRLDQTGQQTQAILDQVSTNTADIAQLRALYEALTQNEPVIIQPSDTWPVADPQENVIYRVIDRVNTPPQSYSDYMWNGTAMVLMATYNNPIDNEPTPGSNNLVKSGGVAASIVFDISAYHATGSTLATYANLAAALGTDGANVPASVRKGGMSVKFVQTSDNKYVQYRLMADSWSTAVADWQGVDNEPTVGSNNLVKSGGVYNSKLISRAYDSWERIFDENAIRKNGYGIVALSNHFEAEDELFVVYHICKGYSHIRVRSIVSNHWNVITFYDNTHTYISSVKSAEDGFIITDIPNNAYFVAVSYYIDSYATNNNLLIYDGFTMTKENEFEVQNARVGEVALSSNTVEIYDGYIENDGGAAFYLIKEVSYGEIYKINGDTSRFYYPKTVFFIDSENHVILHSESTQLNGIKIAVPKGSVKMIVQSRSTFELKLEYIGKLNCYDGKSLLVDYGHLVTAEGFHDDSDCVCSDYISIKAKKIFLLNLPSNNFPTICFYTKTKRFIGNSTINVNMSGLYVEVNVPDKAEYIKFNSMLSDITNFNVIIDGILFSNIQGRFTKNVSVLQANKIKLFDAGTISGYPISMGPTVFVDGNYIYSVCDKRVSQADSGISHIGFVKYDKENNQFIYKKILFESSNETGRYHNGVVFIDKGGILGTPNRIYVFVLKVNANAIDVYISNIDSQSQSDFVYKYSDDGGDTWSNEVSLKTNWINLSVFVFGTSPAQAVVINDTLVLPGYVVVDPNEYYAPTSEAKFRAGYITYKNGVWNFNVIDFTDADTDNECSVCEYKNGAALINVRDFKGVRKVYNTSKIDSNPQTFIHPSSDTFLTYNLYGCQGSIAKYGDYYLFFYVNDYSGARKNPCIYLTSDMFNFYPILSLEEGIVGGYGNIQVIDDNVYVVYESNSERTEISVINITSEISGLLQKYGNIISYNDVNGYLGI